MKYLIHAINQLLIIFYMLRKINFFKIFSKNKKGSDNVIWLWPNSPFGLIRYLATAAVVHDIALLCSASKNLDDYEIFVGRMAL